MDPYSNLNSASRVHEKAEKQNRRIAAECAERERQKKRDQAQLESAKDLRKMLETMQENQKEQAKESLFNRRLAIASFIVAVLSLLIAWLR